MFQLLFTVLTQDFSYWVKAKVNFLNKYVHFSVLTHNQTTAHCKCTLLAKTTSTVDNQNIFK